MVKRGFLPCFSRYLHRHFPLEDFYQKPSHVTKVKVLLSALVDSQSPFDLKRKIGQEVQTIRPNSKEGKSLIKLCSSEYPIHRIDYGNNPFRIVFCFSNANRMAYIYIIDPKHKTMRGRHR